MDISFGGGGSIGGGDNPLSAAASAAGDVTGAVDAAASAAGDVTADLGGAVDAAASAAGDVTADIGGAIDVAASAAGDLTASIGGALDAAGSLAADVGGSISGDLSLGLAAGAGLAAGVGAAAMLSGGLHVGGGIHADVGGGFLTGIFGTKVSKASQQLVKARIHDDDTGHDVLECLFNPDSYTITKSGQGSWKKTILPKLDLPWNIYTGGDLMTMSFKLWFDTLVTPNRMKPGDMDVRCYTDILLNLMRMDPEKHNVTDPRGGGGTSKVKGRPHVVSFHWGNSWSFKGVITKVTLKFTLFQPDGTPVRATADVEMQQLYGDQYKRQNPTSGGEDLRASHVVQPGDTLDLIAYQEYGDATLWRLLARANGIEDPRSIRPGQRLMVPTR